MNRMISALTTAILLTALPLTASARAEEFTLHARVGYDAGGTLIKGATDADWANAAVNTLVMPGDLLWIENGGTMELEMAGGTFVRMADASKMEIQALPPTATVRGWFGSFYVHRVARSKGDFTFVAPACKVDITADAMIRVDVVRDGGTTVSARWGRAIIRTDVGDPIVLDAGQRCWVDPGLLPSMPAAFDTSAEDTFDAWNRERGEVLATGPRSIPKTVVVADDTIGFTDLDYCGEWVYVDDHPYWHPTIVTNYIPYRYGYWSYVPSVGNTWVGNYPFCYVTSHYGRWVCTPSYGWVWSYDPVWSPAWVASVRCGDYFMWAPVGYNCMPVYQTESVCFSVGGVNFGLMATTCVPVSNIYYGPSFYGPMNNDYVHYFHEHPHDTYIWNISIHNDPPVHVPYHHDQHDSPMTVRNYAPQRSIRGPMTVGQDGMRASERVRTLESNVARNEFTSISRTGKEGVRTASAPANRTADVRTLRLEKPSATAMPTHFERPPRSADAVASTPDRATRTKEDATGIQSRTSDAHGGVRNVAPASDTQGGRSPEGRTPTVRGAEVSGDAPQRTPTRTAPGMDNGTRSRAYDGGVSNGRQGSSRSGAESGGRTIQHDGTETPRTQAPDSGRSATRSRENDVKAPSPTPSRTSVRTTPTPSPERSYTPAPSRSTERTAPSPERSTPSRSTVRTTPSPERSYTPAPSRSTVRSTPSPERSYTPAPSRALPEPTPAPGRSIGNIPRSRDISSTPSAPRYEAPRVERSEPVSIPRNEQHSAPSSSRSSVSMERPSASSPEPSGSISRHGRR